MGVGRLVFQQKDKVSTTLAGIISQYRHLVFNNIQQDSDHSILKRRTDEGAPQNVSPTSPSTANAAVLSGSKCRTAPMTRRRSSAI